MSAEIGVGVEDILQVLHLAYQKGTAADKTSGYEPKFLELHKALEEELGAGLGGFLNLEPEQRFGVRTTRALRDLRELVEGYQPR